MNIGLKKKDSLSDSFIFKPQNICSRKTRKRKDFVITHTFLPEISILIESLPYLLFGSPILFQMLFQKKKMHFICLIEN